MRKVQFVLEKETLNAVRYREEVPADGSDPVIGMQYVRKAALKKAFGTIPDVIYVTIEAE